MDYQQVSTSLRECISDIALRDDIDTFSRLLDDEIIDSFAMLAILTHIEVELGVEIDPDLVTSERFESVDTLSKWILDIQKGN